MANSTVVLSECGAAGAVPKHSTQHFLHKWRDKGKVSMNFWFLLKITWNSRVHQNMCGWVFWEQIEFLWQKITHRSKLRQEPSSGVDRTCLLSSIWHSGMLPQAERKIMVNKKRMCLKICQQIHSFPCLALYWRREPSKQTSRCQGKATNALNVSWAPITLCRPAAQQGGQIPEFALHLITITDLLEFQAQTPLVAEGKGKSSSEDNSILLDKLTLCHGQFAVTFNVSMLTISARAQACKILNINESTPVCLGRYQTPATQVTRTSWATTSFSNGTPPAVTALLPVLEYVCSTSPCAPQNKERQSYEKSTENRWTLYSRR